MIDFIWINDASFSKMLLDGWYLLRAAIQLAVRFNMETLKDQGEGKTSLSPKYLAAYKFTQVQTVYVENTNAKYVEDKKEVKRWKPRASREDENVKKIHKTEDFTTCYWADDSMRPPRE